MNQSKRKSLKAFGAGLVGIVLFLSTLYGLFRVYDYFESKKQSVGNVKKQHIWLKLGRDFKKYEPFLRAPGTILKVIKTVDGQLIYDQTYQSDEGLFRVPVKQNDHAKSYVIFAGCSFVWGEGLKDEDTIEWKFAEQNSDYNAYNLGFPGGSLQTLIHHAHLFPLKKIVKEKNGYYIYTFILNHLDRFYGRYNYMDWASIMYPHYEIENGKAVFKGPIGQQPSYTKFIKTREAGLKNTLIKTQDPLKWSDEELEKFSVGVAILSGLYHEQFKHGKFVFMIHPQSGLSDELRGRLKFFMKKAGIEIWDPTDDFKSWSKRLKSYAETEIHQYDGHPSGKSNEFLSSWVAQKIKKAD